MNCTSIVVAIPAVATIIITTVPGKSNYSSNTALINLQVCQLITAEGLSSNGLSLDAREYKYG